MNYIRDLILYLIAIAFALIVGWMITLIVFSSFTDIKDLQRQIDSQHPTSTSTNPVAIKDMKWEMLNWIILMYSLLIGLMAMLQTEFLMITNCLLKYTIYPWSR